MATFTYSDSTGKVSYVGAVASQGKATCWLNISPNGKFLYGTDSASDAISVYSLTNPLKPALIQEFSLNGPTVAPGASTAAGPTSQDFQFSFDPSGNYLYVLNHTISDAFQQGNQLHTINVGSNGKLSESGSPLFFSPAYVPGTAHVLGLVVATEVNPANYIDTVVSQLLATTIFSSSSNAALEALIDSLLQDIVTSAYN